MKVSLTYHKLHPVLKHKVCTGKISGIRTFVAVSRTESVHTISTALYEHHIPPEAWLAFRADRKDVIPVVAEGSSLERPDCQRCIRSGLQCEGYARRAVFINKTSQGILKRPPLEETLPRVPATTAALASGVSGQQTVIPQQMNMSQAMQTHFEGIFLNGYLANGSTTQWPSPGIYVAEVISLPRDWLLEAAIPALCITRVGRKFRDADLVQQGMQFYGKALARLRYAVMRPEKVMEDSTFAAAKILNLYEVYEPTHRLVQSVFNHTRGLNAISQIRGLGGNRSKVAALIMQASRYNAMIACIQDLHNSPLAGIEWRTTSWSTITDFEQGLVDIGFDIGKLVQEMVYIFTIHSNTSQHEVNQDILSIKDIAIEFVAVEKSLSSWLSRFTLWMPIPACWEADRFEVPQGTELVLDFANIRVAHILTDFWTLQIVFAVTLARASYVINRRFPTDIAWNETPAIVKLHSLSSKYDDAAQIKYASYIEAAMPYCCQPQMGSVGPQRTMFQIGVLVFFYRQIEGQSAQRKVKQTLETMHWLNERIGVDFADHSVEDRPLPQWARKIGGNMDVAQVERPLSMSG